MWFLKICDHTDLQDLTLNGVSVASTSKFVLPRCRVLLVTEDARYIVA
jgi:hypothetical protein